MRIILSITAAFVISLFTTFVNAQVQWIADAELPGTQKGSLYKMLEDGQPVVIAVGNIHAQSSERLLATGALQKLSAEHDAGLYGERFSAKDLRVAFINVQVIAGQVEHSLPQGLRLVNMSEEDNVFSSAGWQELYSIAGTHLFLVTPDHLVRPLHGTTAEELYREVSFFSSKVRPSATPDVRLLDAVTTGADRTAKIRVQNFSTLPVQNIEVSIMKNGQHLAQTVFTGTIASLEDAVISINLPEFADENYSIVAKAEGDSNPFNNRWTGALRNTGDASMIVVAR